MPPKRAAAAAVERKAPSPSSAAPKKRGRPAKSITTDKDDASDAAPPAPVKTRGRPKKQPEEVEAAPIVEVKRGRGRPRKEDGAVKEVTSKADDDAAPKVRGRAAKSKGSASTEEAPVKKGRGRPKKVVEPVAGEVEPVPATEKVEPVKKTRGRPRKVVEEADEIVVNTDPEPKTKRGRVAKTSAEAPAGDAAPPKPRGRPRKNTEVEDAPAVVSVPKARGRPKKVKEEVATTQAEPPKKRGRPPKTAVAEDVADAEPKRKRGRPAKSSEAEKVDEPAPKKARGRPAKAKPEPAAAVTPEPDASAAESSRPSGSRAYWLMKAEPESRLETTASGKQVDVRFSIDDLASRTSPEPWDGIRNFVARNNLRAMEVGDLAFFSESNTKVPGIVGIMEVVGTAWPDPSQFDPDSPYYDPKSAQEKPKWDMVLVKLHAKFTEKIPSSLLKTHAGPGQPLENLQLLKQSRLSISRVEEDEWEFINTLAQKRDSTPDRPAAPAARTPVKSPKKKVRVQTPAEQAAGIERLPSEGPEIAEALPTKGPLEAAAEALAAVVGATPASRKRKLDAAVPATEPRKRTARPVADEEGATAPASEPRPRGRPRKSAAAASAPADGATAPPQPPTKTSATPTGTPFIKKRSKADHATPATEPRARTLPETPSTAPDAQAGSKTEPRPRGRPRKSVVVTAPTDTRADPDPEAQQDASSADELVGETLTTSTPAPRKRKADTAAPATEPKRRAVAQTPASKPTAFTLGAATEPRPRGRPRKSVVVTAPAEQDAGESSTDPQPTDGKETQGVQTPAPKSKTKARNPGAATEPRPKPQKDAQPAVPATEPRKRGRPPKAAMAVETKTPAPVATDDGPTGEKDETAPAPDARFDGQTPTRPRVRGVPATAPPKKTSKVQASAPAPGIQSERHVSFFAPPAHGRQNQIPTAPQQSQASSTTALSSQTLSLPETNTAEDISMRDWDADESGAVDDTFAALHDADGADAALPSTEAPEQQGPVVEDGYPVLEPGRLQTPPPLSPSRATTFLGRIGGGIVNVLTSPGRVVSRALSATPRPESREGLERSPERAQGRLEGVPEEV